MRVWALAPLLLTGCTGTSPSEQVPGYPDAQYATGDCEGAWSVDAISLGIWAFAASWDERFGFNNAVSYSLGHLHIRCVPEDWHSEYWDADIAGLTKQGETLVALKAKASGKCRTLPQSAFLHELTHTALMACCGNGDADHAKGTKYGTTWTKETDAFLADVTVRLQDLLDEVGTFEPDDDGTCYRIE